MNAYFMLAYDSITFVLYHVNESCFGHSRMDAERSLQTNAVDRQMDEPTEINGKYALCVPLFHSSSNKSQNPDLSLELVQFFIASSLVSTLTLIFDSFISYPQLLIEI